MPTINQLIRQGRKTAANRTKAPALDSCPQKRGVCTRVMTQTPKKPCLLYTSPSPRDS